jgi:aminopeptidase N
MKQKISQLVIALFFVGFLSSCSLAGLNLTKKTPWRGDKYPNFTKKDSVRGALNEFRTCFDVKEYRIYIDVNTEKKYLKGYVDIDFSVVTSCTTIQIDLFKNMTMDSILYDGKKVNFSRKYGAVYVSFPQQLTNDSEKSIRCFYQGNPIVAKNPPWDGGFVWKVDANKNPWVGVACEVIGASLWWPCKDHISDEPERGVSLTVTVPQGLTVVSNGKQQLHETEKLEILF